jgi:hypothetical protein
MKITEYSPEYHGDSVQPSVHHAYNNPKDFQRVEPGAHFVMMSPSQFLRLVPLSHYSQHYDEHGNPDRMGTYLTVSPKNVRAIELHIKKTKKFSVGFLKVNRNNEVYNHEGRHTAIACQNLGIMEIPVLIRGAGAEKFNPDTAIPQYPAGDEISQKKHLDELNRELAIRHSQGGWFRDSERHAKASRIGWCKVNSLRSNKGQGGWFKQRRRHAVAARKRR